jgi:hypothetical protein
MRHGLFAAVVSLLAAVLPQPTVAADQGAPIALHPDNGHYFIFDGKPTVLITSGEHYGAVLNSDFDYARYFEELNSKGLNLTRTVSGVYREVPGSFNIKDNTLAPKDESYVSPWARSGNKYDLSRWNPAYFDRLKAYLQSAADRGVVVEFVLFCTFYEDTLWDICPLNHKNNVNNVGRVARNEAHTLKEKPLVAHQLAFVRKVVTELKDFDNLYYEVCNEPYFQGVADDWQRLVAQTIVDAERDFAPSRKHLIARNIANGSTKIDNPDPNVSIFNFHYCHPPDAVSQNYALNKVVAYDETGFRGTGDTVYRTHAWEFILAGGAVYSHLDYSFTPNAEDGSAPVNPPQPGGGGPTLRRQLQVLKDFIHGFDLLRMKPDNGIVKSKPQGVTTRALVEPGKQYALYVSRIVAEKGPNGKETGKFSDPAAGKAARLELDLPAGSYQSEWVHPRTGKRQAAKLQADGKMAIETPPFEEDIALRLTAGNR